MKPLLLCMHNASATCFHFVMFLSSMLLPRLLSPTLRICVISCSPLDMADTRGMARVHTCADCGAKFSDGDVLDDHIVQVHLDGKPYDGEGDHVSNSDSMDGTSIEEESSDEESSDDEEESSDEECSDEEGEADDEESSDDEEESSDEDSDGLVTANGRARHNCWR